MKANRIEHESVLGNKIGKLKFIDRQWFCIRLDEYIGPKVRFKNKPKRTKSKNSLGITAMIIDMVSLL